MTHRTGGRLRAPTAASPLDGGRAAGDSAGTDRSVGSPEAFSGSLELLDVLVGLLEYRDPYFRGGSAFVRLLALSIGRELKLTEEQLRSLGIAALLRDLGRMAMKGELIAPFSASPAPHERSRIEQHVATSLNLLAGARLPEEVLLAIRHHHENWNGSGYPDGLSGEKIPFLARILNVADTMAAMLSPRPYRPPKRAPDALRELREAAGISYDPAVVEALVTVLRNLDPAELGFALHGHLLLVHGDPARAATLAVHLGSHGFLVDIAAELDSARERLARLPFLGALIAADAPLGSSGAASVCELVAELRSDRRFQTIPVVAVDATSTDLRLELIQAGFDACFAEDTPASEIVATMHAFLRRTAILQRYLEPEHDAVSELMQAATEDIRPVAEPADTTSSRSLYALQGSIGEFPLAWLLQAMQYDRRTALVHISLGDQEGLIALEEGELRHATLGAALGEAAMNELLGWREGSFRVRPGARVLERTVRTPLIHIILEHARCQDEAQPIFGTVA